MWMEFCMKGKCIITISALQYSHVIYKAHENVFVNTMSYVICRRQHALLIIDASSSILCYNICYLKIARNQKSIHFGKIHNYRELVRSKSSKSWIKSFVHASVWRLSVCSFLESQYFCMPTFHRFIALNNFPRYSDLNTWERQITK